MKSTIALSDPPHPSAAHHVLYFSEAALTDGYEIVRLLSYQDGMHGVLTNVVSGQDEFDPSAAWRELVEHSGLDAVVYIAATLRRGTLSTEEVERYDRPGTNSGASWEPSGLDQLHEAAQSTDRLVCFGGSR